MWVYEEMIEGKKLTDIINSEHENVKYLPGIKLPNNVVSCERRTLVLDLRGWVSLIDRLSLSNIRIYSGTSLLRTLWDLDFSPYYRGVLNSEVI